MIQMAGDLLPLPDYPDFVGEAFGNSALRAQTLRDLAEHHRVYIILFLPRSGSSWLGDLLSTTGTMGEPQEYFNRKFLLGDRENAAGKPPKLLGISDINEYVCNVVRARASSNGVAGVELGYRQAVSLIRHVEAGAVTPRMALFYVRRDDLIAQGVSLYRATVSGMFNARMAEIRARRGPIPPVVYDREGLIANIRAIAEGEQSVEAILSSCGMQPLRILYSDIVDDPQRVVHWMQRVVGIEEPVDPTDRGVFARQANDQSSEWISRLRVECADEIAEIERMRPPLLSDAPRA